MVLPYLKVYLLPECLLTQDANNYLKESNTILKNIPKQN